MLLLSLQETCPWPTRGPTQMVRSSSSPQPRQTGTCREQFIPSVLCFVITSLMDVDVHTVHDMLCSQVVRTMDTVSRGHRFELRFRQ